MSGRGQTLRNLRVEASGIVQMLLFAILLQLSFPVSASLADAATALSRTDSALCSSQGKPAGAADLGGHTESAAHCVFCLPLLSMAATPADDTVLPVPNVVVQETAPAVAVPVQALAVALSGDARAPPFLR